jgi:hypothetical protein
VADFMDKMQRLDIKYVDAQADAAREWKTRVVQLCERTLLPTTTSPYMGGNPPGKTQEPMCYTNGLPSYRAEIRAALDSMQGFEVVHN